MKLRFPSSFTAACAALLFSIPFPSHLEAATPLVEMEAGRLKVLLSPDAKWTIRGIKFDGIELGQSNGNYGTVIAHSQAQFIGAAHTEGGEEEVLELQLTSDGATVEPSKQQISGEIIERTKRSSLGSAFILNSKLTIRDARIDETITLKASEAVPLHSLYPLMFIWSKESTAWACTTTDGRYLTGTLQSDGEWKGQEDVKWLAVYHPHGEMVSLAVFPEGFPAGKSRKHALWDHPAYHKQYFIAGHNDQVQPDEEFHYTYTIHFLKVEGGDWQGAVNDFLNAQGS